MNAMQRVGRKLAVVAVVLGATCFGYGGCDANPYGYMSDGFEIVEEWYEDEYYYEDAYYDDCSRGCGDGFGFWFDWF